MNNDPIYEIMAKQAAYLRQQSQKMTAELQEHQKKFNERIQRAYQGWDAVPEGLCTRTQLRREGRYVPDRVAPVAEVYSLRGKTFYDLYRREDAVPKGKKALDQSH